MNEVKGELAIFYSILIYYSLVCFIRIRLKSLAMLSDI